jgi:hypothetical protein
MIFQAQSDQHFNTHHNGRSQFRQSGSVQKLFDDPKKQNGSARPTTTKIHTNQSVPEGLTTHAHRHRQLYSRIFYTQQVKFSVLPS